MSERDRRAFLQPIQTDPAGATARLVYADWLDERGDPDAELVRLLCEVQASGYVDGPAWERLESLTGGLEPVLGRRGEREQRLFACDCAERVLPYFEQAYPDDGRPRRTIDLARRYALGRATVDMLGAADAVADTLNDAAGSPAAWCAANAADAASWGGARAAQWAAPTAASAAAAAAGGLPSTWRPSFRRRSRPSGSSWMPVRTRT